MRAPLKGVVASHRGSTPLTEIAVEGGGSRFVAESEIAWQLLLSSHERIPFGRTRSIHMQGLDVSSQKERLVGLARLSVHFGFKLQLNLGGQLATVQTTSTSHRYLFVDRSKPYRIVPLGRYMFF